MEPLEKVILKKVKPEEAKFAKSFPPQHKRDYFVSICDVVEIPLNANAHCEYLLVMPVMKPLEEGHNFDLPGGFRTFFSRICNVRSFHHHPLSRINSDKALD